LIANTWRPLVLVVAEAVGATRAATPTIATTAAVATTVRKPRPRVIL